ncbi:MAG: lipoyl synthase [Chloroflexi bacterium]|nr:lipoyl synthase [Chloroflexota bacterium]
MTASESARAATPPIDPARGRPPWLTIRVGAERATTEVRQLLGDLGLHTVCEEARCPNQRECWDSRTATFLILGDRCTRRCSYCAIETGQPSGAVDWAEPGRIARAVSRLGLRHVVVTSVTRDDLEDGGAGVFAATVRRIRAQDPACSIEVLIPDLGARRSAIETVVRSGPDVVNHNIETVRRLHDQVRPRCGYDNSLRVLALARELGGRCTKSGLMVGLGETLAEVDHTLADLRSARVDIVTIGQYLRPTGQSRHVPVSRYYTPAEFETLRASAMGLGFAHVEAGPLVRSSYHAREQLEQHRQIDTIPR